MPERQSVKLKKKIIMSDISKEQGSTLNKAIEYNGKLEKLMPQTKLLIRCIFYAFISLLYLVIVIKVTWHDIIVGHLIAIGVVFLVLIVIPLPMILVSVGYLYEDLSKKVFIDREKKLIIIKKWNKEIIITKSDIVKSFHVKGVGKPRYRYYEGYEYVLLVLKERVRIYITNLLIDSQDIISLFSLNCKEIQTTTPFIDRRMGAGVFTTAEFEQKIKEFEVNFQDYPNEKLHGIIMSKKEYASYAIEAAKNILEKRKQKR